MLLPSEQTLLNHAGLNPQSIATLGSALGARASIVQRSGGDNSTGAGSRQGGANTANYGLFYAETTQPAGNTVANTVIASEFASQVTIPANFLQVGNIITVRAFGVFSTDVAAPTLTLQVRLDTTTILTTGAVTVTASLTNVGWNVEALIAIRASGAGGSIESQGIATLGTAVASSIGVGMVNTASTAIALNTARLVNMTAKWGTASANNTITLRNFIVRLEQAQNFS